MRFFFWLIVLPLTVLIAVFAIDNRAEMTLSLSPLPYTITLPVYLCVLASIFLGFAAGAIFSWFTQGKWRRMARRYRRRVEKLEGGGGLGATAALPSATFEVVAPAEPALPIEPVKQIEPLETPETPKTPQSGA